MFLLLTIAAAHAAAYQPLAGNALFDADGDGYIALAGGQGFAVPLLNHEPMDEAYVDGLAEAEGDTLWSWGAFADDDAPGGTVDGLIWMMTVREGEPMLLVAMDRDLNIGLEPYGDLWLMAAVRRADDTVTATPEDWLVSSLGNVQRYHELIESELIPSATGWDGSTTCGSEANPMTGTLDMYGFDDPQDAYGYNQGEGQDATAMSFGWILIALGGCSTECASGTVVRNMQCDTQCMDDSNWCGDCVQNGLGEAPDCEFSPQCVGGVSVDSPAEYQLP